MKKSRSGSSKANLFCLLAGILLTVSSLFGLKKSAKEPEIGRSVYQKIEAQAVKQQQADKPESNEFQKVQIDFKHLSKINKDIIGWLLFDQPYAALILRIRIQLYMGIICAISRCSAS